MKYVVTFTYKVEVEEAEDEYHAVQLAVLMIREDTTDDEIVDDLVAFSVQAVEGEEGN